MKSRFLLAMVLLGGGAIFGAEPEIELRGIVVGANATKLSLVDKSSNRSQWVEVGQSFAGFSVKGYDPATEMATLTKDGKEKRLRLLPAKIPEAPTEPQKVPPGTGYVSPGDTAAKIAARHNLTVQQLLALNPGVQWSQLKVGQTLKVK